MATGTAPMTGTIRTGMTGMRPPQPRQALWTRAMQWWNGMAPRQRMMVGISALAIVLLIGVSVKIQKSTAYVNLYENALSPDEMNDVSIALAQSHIPYEKTLDNHVIVPPSRRVEAASTLMQQGIPRHPFQLLTNSNTETQEQFNAEQHLRLEQDITMILRQFTEIADANVKLVIPSENSMFFRDEEEQAKAAVVVKLKPGYDKLPLEKAKAIVNFVSSSVPHLKPENVELTDTNGRLLSDWIKDSKDDNTGGKMIERKTAFEKTLESKVRGFLDPVLGAGKYTVAVNVDLNEDHIRSVKQSNGNELNGSGALPEQQQIDTEKYSKNPQQSGSNASDGARQLAYSTDETGATHQGGDYLKEHKLTKYRIDTTETQTEVMPGQDVKRITASILTEEKLSTENEQALRAATRNAIGYSAERGDSLSFGMLPFHYDELKALGDGIGTGAGSGSRGPSLVNGAMILRVAASILIFGIIGIALYLYREQKARMEKTQLVLAAGPATTVSGISDLLNEKTGKVTIPATTATNAPQSQKLEQLVKEKPTKVAELLKTTWLAEK